MNYHSRLISDFNGLNVFIQKLRLCKKLKVLEVSEIINIRSLSSAWCRVDRRECIVVV